jgi:predicted NUDIX family NTP pyrophosphohydrolase
VPAYPPNTPPPKRGRISAGLLMYRRRGGVLEVFIAHPGGPWFPHREVDVWTIPKGEIEPNEEPLAAAIREFQEEVGIVPNAPYFELGSIRQRGGKTVHAWGFEGDWDESQPIHSNTIEVEWPPGSGRQTVWPEIDKAGFFTLDAARSKMKLAQQPLLDRLVASLKGNGRVVTEVPEPLHRE